MNENEQVFINMSGDDAKQKVFLLRQASQAYNSSNYLKWCHILSSIQESIFHKIAEDDETFDILFNETEKLQKHWTKYQDYKSKGWKTDKKLIEGVREYIISVRLYSRAIMSELNRQGYFPNRKSMSETRHE